MTHQVALAEFSGPLDLMLELIEKNRLDISSISLAEITSEYVERIERLETDEPESVAAFLHVAARLILLKSRYLLHLSDPEDDEGDEPSLEEQLRTYQRYRQVADELAGHEAAAEAYPGSLTPALSGAFIPIREDEYRALASLYTELLRIAPPDEPEPELLPLPRISLEHRSRELHRLLEKAGRLDSAHLFGGADSKLDIVITFLALLDVLRRGIARVSQEAPFATITLESI